LAFLLLYLTAEKLRLDRALRRVPRRIAVTGTRGKSGVTRLVAAGLRASGARVLAKTTGSKPVLILPDGSEREIPRTGAASIREQVRLVAFASASGADALVTEMMSIGAECLGVESRRILRPGILAVTNVRLDHRDEMGRDRPAVAATLASAVPEGAEIFVPAEEAAPAFAAAAARRGARLRPVAKEEAGEILPPGEFEPNRRLARAVLRSLGIDDATIARGFAAARPDPGQLRIFRGTYGRPARPAVCLGLFAANDPESSAAALAGALKHVSARDDRPLVALLSLREDRGDRTRQWIEAAGRGFFDGFAAVFLTGPPARAALPRVRRRLGRAGPAAAVAAGRTPEEMMSAILSSVPPAPVVAGLGNFVGRGEEISRYWEDQGNGHGA
jgi:poly-gamma-glutamate synthase PgsB/CapB